MSNQYHLPKSRLLQCDILAPLESNPHKAVDYINSCIDKIKGKNLTVDISFMNIMDACYVSTMCSTKHFIKYPDGKISWYVSSELVSKYTNDMKLGNSEFVVKR